MSCHIVVMMDVLRLYMLAPYVEESSLRQFQKFFKLLKGKFCENSGIGIKVFKNA